MGRLGFSDQLTSIVNQDAAVLAAPYLVTPYYGIAAGSDLDSGVQVVEDIVLFQAAVSVVVEIHADLFPRMDSVPSENRRTAGCDPDSGQRIGVNFILLDEALAFLVHVDASVLAVMNFVMAHNGVRVGANLNARQSVAVNVVVFDESATFAEDVHASLVAVVDIVFTYRWITVRRDPHTGEVVRVYFVHEELAAATLVYVDPTGLPVMDFAADNGRVGSGFHFEAGDAIVVDIVRLKVAESVIKRKHTNVPAVMNMISAHYWVGMVFHPNSSKCISETRKSIELKFCVESPPYRVCGRERDGG